MGGETPQEIIFEGCRVYAIAPEDYDAMVRDLATMEQNVREARAEVAAARAEVASEVDDWRHRHATEQELRLMYEKALRDLECLSRGVALSGPVLGRVVAVNAQCRADERAQLAARATEQERGMVRELADLASCDGASEAEEFSPETLATEQAILAALTASRERAIEECAEVCDSIVAMWRAEARRTVRQQYADEFNGNAKIISVVATNIRALAAPAVADTTVPEVAAGAAPQRAEGEGA